MSHLKGEFVKSLRPHIGKFIRQFKVSDQIWTAAVSVAQEETAIGLLRYLTGDTAHVFSLSSSTTNIPWQGMLVVWLVEPIGSDVANDRDSLQIQARGGPDLLLAARGRRSLSMQASIGVLVRDGFLDRSN